LKRILWSLAIVVVIALAALAWSFAPIRLPAPQVSTAQELPPASPPPEMSISVLPTGALASRAALAYRGGAFTEHRSFGMPALLVRHPRGDLLFDSGLGRDVDTHVASLPAIARALTDYQADRPAGEQLREHGIDPATLAGVLLTHAHWDHVSGLDSLAGVPVWVNDEELAFIEGDSPNAALIRSFPDLRYHRYEFEHGAYLGHPRSLDVWGDGAIVIVPAPGHTPGSILVYLSLPSGQRYLLLGDLVWQTEGITLPAERPWLARHLIGEDSAQVRAQIAQVAALHQHFPQLHLLPAHDVRAFTQLPVFPAGLHLGD
jgi:N-acyl homoserine lactone hydrolase